MSHRFISAFSDSGNYYEVGKAYKLSPEILAKLPEGVAIEVENVQVETEEEQPNETPNRNQEDAGEELPKTPAKSTPKATKSSSTEK